MTNDPIPEDIKVHGVDIRCFNTTTNHDKVYMVLHDSDRVLDANYLFNMWSYIHNRAVHVLRGVGFLDRYGRLCKIINWETFQLFCQRTRQDSEKVDGWWHGIRNAVCSKNLPEWSKLYPKDLLYAAIDQVVDEMVQKGPAATFEELEPENAVIDMELRRFENDLKTMQLWMDTEQECNVMELMLSNQYENSVSLVIKSNTTRGYDYMETLSKHISSLGKRMRIIMRYRENRGSKILCTFLCE